MYFAGVDIGSTMTKVVIISQTNESLSQVIGPTGAEHRRLANEVMAEALIAPGWIERCLQHVVATGFVWLLISNR